jgi:hypothetical protein
LSIWPICLISIRFASNGVKYKPPKRKRHVSRSITYLIPHSKHILLVLLKKNNNVNGVFRSLEQTGFKYKRDVLDCMDYMEKAKLITKQTTKNSMKMEVSLTALGNKTATVITNTKKYISSRSKLEQSVADKLSVTHMSEIKAAQIKGCKIFDQVVQHNMLVYPGSILKNRGWGDDEILRFAYDGLLPTLGIRHLINKSPNFVISILLDKYRMLLELEPNDLARTIIQKIIIDLITELMEYVHSDPHFYHGRSEQERIVDQMTGQAMRFTDRVTADGGFRYKFMTEEVTEVLDSIFSIIETRGELIQKRIDKWIESEKHKPRYELISYLHDKKTDSLPFYEKIVKKWS